MIRLGFAVRVVGQAGLRARPSIEQHDLSRGLVWLHDLLHYLGRVGIRFYRMAAGTPAAGPGLASLLEWREELALLGQRVANQGLRLSMHLNHTVALGSADATQVGRSLAEIEYYAALLEGMEGPERAVMVLHVGGHDGASLGRFANHYRALSVRARARLAVEHDGAGWSLGALLGLHQRCGVPVVFDMLHWQLLNPERLPLDLALGLALATWPAGLRPEVHLSSARSEAHLVPERAGQPAHILPPRFGQHADFVCAADAVQLLHAARGLPPFDLMLEAKAGDMALLRLREELGRLAPELAARLG
ncbi:MAG: UV damage endonuclease UvsE [Chloroflexaceae bacterium]|nr:UV damage endonuclease UvsE [Chloroflexaceae bacterium]